MITGSVAAQSTSAVNDSPRPATMTQRLAVVPPALALLYPWFVTLLGHSVTEVRHPGSAPVLLAWAGIVAAVALVCAVPLVSVAVAHAIGGLPRATRRDLRARWSAHLAFTAPSLLVAFGNYARMLNARAFVTPAWLVVWGASIAALLLPGGDQAPASAMPVARRIRLRKLHAVSAIALIVIFLAPHIANHITGIWSGAAHIAVMSTLRVVYRSTVVEPVLVALLLLQAASGLTLAMSRLRGRTTDLFQTLQTASGVYIVVFLVSHLAAAFSARAAHVDPNWLWLVGRSGTLLASPVMTVVPHYFFGPLILFAHVGCGVRNMHLARAGSRRLANRIAGGLIAAGAAASIVILLALFGVHIGADMG